MAKTRIEKLAFNRGLISRLGLARADIKRVAMAAEVQTNWMPRVLGSMMLRPGMGYKGQSRSNLRAFHIPFIFSVTDKAIVEITDLKLRVWVTDVLITRPSVSSAVTNGNFDANVTSWTDNDEAGGVSQWAAGGYLELLGNGTAAARRTQQVAVAGANIGVEHALRIVIQRGPVTLKVGTTSGGDDYIAETVLEVGTHSLAFTPSVDFYVDFSSRLNRIVYVDSCNVEAAGVMEITAPWLEADLRKIRFDQSGDVLFVACAGGYQQRRIERRAARSWSVVKYLTTDGPFRVQNVGPTTLTPAALTGNTTITASAALFRSTHVGSIWQITSEGQTVTKNIAAQNTFSDPIRITGVGTTRSFSISITGTWVATVTLQRSFDDGVSWVDVTSYTINTTTTYSDGLDNQIILYRIGVKTGDYTSGTVVAQLSVTTGSITGVVRVTAFTTSVLVSVEVLTALGGTSATDVWAEGEWSDYRGWPSAVALHDGRLTWAGKDKFLASISDAYDGFDPNFEGDAGPIQRSIGSGPVDTINWMLSLQRLILGGQGKEFTVKSSSLDEPLTPTNFNLKGTSSQGSAPVAAVAVDDHGIFVQRGGIRVFELVFGDNTLDYVANNLSALVPRIGYPGIVRVVVQRQPDTRLHCIRSDGTVAVLVFDKTENVICWIEVETDGLVEDAVVLPQNEGEEEDWVYYSVKRTLNGATARCLEKWAFEQECLGDQQLCKLADSYVSYAGVATTTVTAAHLANENVVIWADGADVGTASDGTQTYTLNGSGQTTLPAAVSNYVVGLPYTAPWKSAKLVELSALLSGSGMLAMTLIKSLGLIMADVHAKGLKYGTTLTESEMQDLPEVEEGAVVDPDAVRSEYSGEPITFPGQWSSNSRLCLLAKAPRPCTILAAIAEVESHG